MEHAFFPPTIKVADKFKKEGEDVEAYVIQRGQHAAAVEWYKSLGDVKNGWSKYRVTFSEPVSLPVTKNKSQNKTMKTFDAILFVSAQDELCYRKYTKARVATGYLTRKYWPFDKLISIELIEGKDQ